MFGCGFSPDFGLMLIIASGSAAVGLDSIAESTTDRCGGNYGNGYGNSDDRVH
jgi:hypothetical protein